MTRVFIIRPFGQKKDSSGKTLDFERVHDELIVPVLKEAKLTGGDTGEIVEAGNVQEDIFSLLIEADLVICDTTIHNANVFYELGIRHALRKKHTILIKGKPTADSIPFDLQTNRYLTYDIDNPASAHKQLVKVIEETLQSNREKDSPIFQLLPTLKETDPSTIQILPSGFREAVERARAAKAKGELRLLAQEIRDQRFQWIGLQLVADIQWHLKDYQGARESLEALRKVHRDNTAVNLALANIYERLYWNEEKPEIFIASEQAIEQVLASQDTHPRDRIEAMTLRGRNKKTRWKNSFKNLTTVNERRIAAMNQTLRECYEAYLAAFHQDLNHFYAGLNALQLGTIFLDLSKEENGTWKNSFNNDNEAKAYRRRLTKEVKDLQVLVPASVEVELHQSNQVDLEQHIWAEVSEADILFLLEKNEQRVINRYKDAIPQDNMFVWDAARRQLQLFADLGIKADLANAVIVAIDDQYTKQEPRVDKPLHVILFTGHCVDAPDRAKQLIRQALSELNQDHDLLGLVSAAPGGDILFHEVCAELNIPSILCLPMPGEDYTRLAFKGLENWRSRFLKLLQKKKEVRMLSDHEGRPEWLNQTKMDPWERGNYWILQMALTAEARTITLLVLRDYKNASDAPVGTAHMVQLAQNTDKVDIKIIDTEELPR